MHSSRHLGHALAVGTATLGSVLLTMTPAVALDDPTCPPTTPVPTSSAPAPSTPAPAPTTTTAAPTSTSAPSPTTVAPRPTRTTGPEPTRTAEPTVTPGGECGLCRTVTPPAPTVTPACGPDNDVVSTQSADGVAWTVGRWKDGKVTVTAVSLPGFTFPVGDEQSWTFTDEAAPCESPTPTPTDCDETCPTPTPTDCDETCPTPTPTDCDETCPTPPGSQPSVTPSGEVPAPVHPSGTPTTTTVPGDQPSTPAPAPVNPEGTPAPVSPSGSPAPEGTATPGAVPVFNSGLDRALSPEALGVAAAGVVTAAGLVGLARRRRDA